MADWKEQSLRLWQNLGKKERYIILGSALLVFIAILSWSYLWGGRPDYVPLFTELSARDAGEIHAKLTEMKITHEVGPGGTILVPAQDVYRIRLDLASQGLPQGHKGFEIFDKSQFGTTEFQNKVDYLQALQGELARTIEQLDEVESARVHIVLPQDSLYKKEEKPSTASIMLRLKPSAELSPGEVKGIVNLVAHSVRGLKPENITVVDNYAHILNAQSDDQQGMAGDGSITQLAMTQKVQEELQKNLQTMLDQVLGPDKAAARVNVELNFDQRTVNSKTYQPVVNTQGIVRSSQKETESYTGSSPKPGGVAGVTSNVPTYAAANNSQSKYNKQEVTTNYEINQTNEKVVATPGSIKRLTVAVMVDSSITPAERASLTKAVASAIGFDPNRGDMISVESIPFSTALADKRRAADQAYNTRQNEILGAKVGAGVLALLALLYVIRLFARRGRMGEAEEQEMALMNEEESLAVITKEMTPQEKARAEQRQEVEKMAKAKPDDVAQLIKVWLTEE
jgi:flagellar M-ring protein FliF